VKPLASSRGIDVEVCFEGGSKRQLHRWLGSDVILSRQDPGSLGERMRRAFMDAFREGCRRVVLLGTDIPELKTHHLGKALDALLNKDMAIGPSTDGGYWLISLRRFADVFQGINWGTRTVLDKTLSLAKARGLKIHQLDALSDIDTVEDLRLWRPDEAIRGPYLSVIIPALNEACRIEAAIGGLQNEEVEVIVVDGGSTDDTVPLAERAGARVERSPCGRAVQQNRGAGVARGKVLLFLHADTLLPTGYVDHVFETLMDFRSTLGAFRFKTDMDRPLMKVIEFVTHLRSQYLKRPYGDQALFIRKSVFHSIGGFPEVPIAEDLLFVRKFSKQGRILIAPAEAVTSARRWQTLGLLRTTLINQIIVAGCYLGISPHALASLYPVPHRKTRSDFPSNLEK
jgi:rSAM/selenodomain-associated transferase 2/rSAM/selenodomain-associated transferase 1